MYARAMPVKTAQKWIEDTISSVSSPSQPLRICSICDTVAKLLVLNVNMRIIVALCVARILHPRASPGGPSASPARFVAPHFGLTRRGTTRGSPWRGAAGIATQRVVLSLPAARPGGTGGWRIITPRAHDWPLSNPSTILRVCTIFGTIIA